MTTNNTITHIEIPAPDFQGTIDFYSKILNWKIQVVVPGGYAFFRIGDTNSGGGFDASLKVAADRHGTQVVVDVDDIAETLSKIESLGGKTTIPRTEIDGGQGFYAGFTDINGNHLQVHSKQ